MDASIIRLSALKHFRKILSIDVKSCESLQSIEVMDVWIRNKIKVVYDLKRIPPHSTGELCAVKVARIVRRGQGACERPALLYKQNCVGVITSARINSQSGSSNSLKTLRLSLKPVIRHLKRQRNTSHTLNTSLDG